MAAFSTIAIVGAVIFAAGTVAKHQAAKAEARAVGRKADAAMKQAELEKRKADIANARQLRAALRQSRIARGQVENLAAQSGTSESSGVLGGLASIGAQEGVNRGVFVQGQDIAEEGLEASYAMAQGFRAQGKARARQATAGAIAGIGGAMFSGAGGFPAIFGA